MAKLEPIRLAGTIAATVMFAAAATEACAQTPPESIVLNNQLQLGDVIAGQTLDVVDAQSQVTASTTSQGNTIAGSVENGAFTITSRQEMGDDVVARTDVALSGDTNAVVNVTTQAYGNHLAASGYSADLNLDVDQTITGGQISAASELGQSDARLLEGASVGAVAAANAANAAVVFGQGSYVQGSIDQSSSATVRSFGRIEAQYIPAEAVVTSEAMANAVSVNSGQTSGQNLELNQRSTGDVVEAGASANAGNGWNLAARARASGNQANLYNEGGSVVVASDQQNSAYVRSAALTTAYDFGSATATSRAAGNDLSVGNNDIHLEIDNNQLNTGGVDSTATFVGTNGYDAYVGADAVGNSVIGYGCSNCQGYTRTGNVQTNQGDVSAVATTTIAGSGRAVVTGANAAGNSASFYISRPGH